MTFKKCVFSKYTATPSNFKTLNFKAFFALSFIFLLSSCNPMSVINPDSYGDKWNNKYVWFNPNNLEVIYVSETGDVKTTTAIPNKTEYSVEWKQEADEYTLVITSNYHPIDFAWFTGYDAENNEEEIPWIKEGNTFTLESSKLLPSEGGLYQISVSDDLTN